MITIPEYIYNNDTIRFVCPSLELPPDDAVQMLTALISPIWTEELRSGGYICYAFRKLGFNTTTVSDALVEKHKCTALDGCLVENLMGSNNWRERYRVANLIRPLWCQHMRDHLEKALKQG